MRSSLGCRASAPSLNNLLARKTPGNTLKEESKMTRFSLILTVTGGLSIVPSALAWRSALGHSGEPGSICVDR